jgi:DivIVA domain-containing protein
VTGDEVRNAGFSKLSGYDASQVNDLLNRIAAELDAGRPAGH